jgi:hypothetical protein
MFILVVASPTLNSHKILTFFGQVDYGMCEYLFAELINGSTSKFVKSSREFRHDFPLSPYLFLLVAE